MHPYSDQIVRPPGKPPGSGAASPPAERGAAVRLVRDGPVPRASCPHCGGRLELSTVGSRWQVRGPGDVADRLLLQLGTLEREELHVLVLNARNVVVDQVRVYQGSVSESVVRIGELFRRAVELHGSAILMCHNHPSGEVKPSLNDVHLTTEAIQAGQLLDIAVLDHLIVGGGTFASLRDYGVVFDQQRDGPAAREPRDRSWLSGGSGTRWVTLTVEGRMEFHPGVPTLADLQRAVGGYVEAVEGRIAGSEATMWLNEEGKLVNGAARNTKAEFICPMAYDWVAGDVAFTGGVGPRGETLSLTPAQVEELHRIDRDVRVILLDEASGGVVIV